jgi:uncharacterized protein (TIGR00645 family)
MRPKGQPKSLSHFLEAAIFRARWLLAPMYLGLIIVLAVLAFKFVVELVRMIVHVAQGADDGFIIDLLGLLDLVLLGNLILIVLFAGYENFVSKIEVAQDSVDRPSWMGGVDFSGLKIKLIGSLVAISVIELLGNFVELSVDPSVEVGQGLIWRIIIHLTFVVSGVLFAVMDWISDNRALKAKSLHHSGHASDVIALDSAI